MKDFFIFAGIIQCVIFLVAIVLFPEAISTGGDYFNTQRGWTYLDVVVVLGLAWLFSRWRR